jgi:diguanylate cyclase (GGDEF)-like protein
MAVRIGSFFVLYVAGAWLATSFIDRPDQVTLIWPSSGLTYATLLLYGLRWWPLTPIAVLLVHLTVAPVPPLFIAFSMAANTLGAVIGAGLVRHFDRRSIDVITVRAGFDLLAGGVIYATIAAGIGVAGLVVAGMLPVADVPGAVAKWAMADLFGMIAVTPAVMIAARWRQWRALDRIAMGYASHREALLWGGVLLATSALFVSGGGLSTGYALGLSALPMAAILWSAVRLPPMHASIGTALYSLFVTSVIGHGVGGFNPPASLGDTIVLLAFMSMLAVIPQMILAASHQNRVAALRLLDRAATDDLTGLLNRTAFEQRARAAIDAAPGETMALAYLDLDQFKLVNDTISHAAGDRLIRQLAGMLATAARGDDLLARTGGDEFAMLLRRCNADQARGRAEAILRTISDWRWSEDGHVVTPGASIGLVPFTAGTVDFATLLALADATCFTAKERGGSRVQVAGPDDRDTAAHTEAMRWATRVARAIDDDRFELHCQKILPLKATGQTGIDFEVLVRLRDEDGSLLAPGLFVPAAERHRLGERLDRHVLGLVLDWLDGHPEHAARVGRCSVNLTAASLDSDGFATWLARRLAGSRMDPTRLCFEITETSAVRSVARAQRFIDDVRALGCRFTLDDFGTGFCSFAYLRSLDVDGFKIDGSFVRDIGSSPAALAIVRAIADIAHVMNRSTIAECVESEVVRAHLETLGVDCAQGYALHRPEPIAAFFAREAATGAARAVSDATG